MPLVANARDNGKNQSPCDLSEPVTVTGAPNVVLHPCALIGTNDKAQDSYSVLASFGGTFGTDTTNGGAKASAGVAQYFSTGIAAQILALNGGASVIATGLAATEAAKHKVDGTTVAALYGDPTTIAKGVADRTEYQAFKPQLIAKIRATSLPNLNARITAFENTTMKEGMLEDCPDVAICAKAVDENEYYRYSYNKNKAKFDNALSGWTTP